MDRKPERRTTLRRRIAVASVAVFVAAWATVFGQSALSGRGETAEAEAEAPRQSGDLTVANLILGLAADLGDEDEEGDGDDAPAPVTSSQS